MSGWDPAGKVDVEDFLESLDVNNVRKEGFHEYRFSCPYPNHDNGDQSASCYMNEETTAFHCHGCKQSGTAISFASYVLGISPVKAKRLIREAYDPSSMNPDERSMVDEVQEIWRKNEKKRQQKSNVTNEIIDESVLLDFDIDWFAVNKDASAPKPLQYLLDRGFRPHTLEEWRFGYDSRKKRITFPVRDHEGHLIGLKGRVTDNRQPKYLMLGDDEESDHYGFGRFQSGLVVFGLDRAKHHADDGLIIVEGELNCVALWQMGYENVVALNGSRLTAQHANLIRRYAEKATFFFDTDRAGDVGLWGYRDDDGEYHPGALKKLSADLDLTLVNAADGDAADYLERGDEDGLHAVLLQREAYISAVLRRRASGLVTS